jgi:hypothetical protein
MRSANKVGLAFFLGCFLIFAGLAFADGGALGGDTATSCGPAVAQELVDAPRCRPAPAGEPRAASSPEPGAAAATSAAIDFPGDIYEGAPYIAGDISARRPLRPLRGASRFGLGFDVAFGPRLGFPGILAEYSLDSTFSLVGGLRFPVGRVAELALEPRFYLAPERPLSLYVGASFGVMRGDIDAMLALIDPGVEPLSARSASTIGLLGGVQLISSTGDALYLEATYLWAQVFAADGSRAARASYPDIAIGYRFFF